MSSTFKVPKQSPMNKSINSNNVTTTKGIAKTLISNTSPQSDSENRPLHDSIAKYVHMNGSAKTTSQSNSISPGSAQYKQSTLSFNGTKSKPVLKPNEFMSSLRGHDSDSDDGTSSDDDVLLVSQQKSKESKPLKTAKVANLQNLKCTASTDGNGIDHGSTPKTKEALGKVGGASKPKSTSVRDGALSSHKSSPHQPKSNMNGSSDLNKGTKEATKIKNKINKVKNEMSAAVPSKHKKPKLSTGSSENGDKSSHKIKSACTFSSSLQKNVISFSISSDEDEPLCKISKVKSCEKTGDKTELLKTESSSVPKSGKKEKAQDKKCDVIKAWDGDESDENEDVPLSLIKQKTLKIKHLKTKPFSANKVAKVKNVDEAGNNLQKQFSTTSDKGKVKVEYQQPPLVLKLMKVLEDEKWKEDAEKVKRVKTLLSHIAKNLTAFQRERVPAPIRDMVANKHTELLEKERWKNLTPQQKEEELKAKRLEAQRKRKEAAAAVMASMVEKPKPIKQDDLLHENVKPLPKPTQITLLDGITMQMYGDILMVIELLHVFKGILSADDCYELDFTVDFLMEALTRGSDGFLFLSSIVEALLKSLLQDQVNELMSELDTDLSKIAVTCHSASDLCRIYLNQVASDAERADDFTDKASLVEAKEQLVSQDFVDLPCASKLAVILFLCQEILRSSTYEYYVQEKQTQYSDCFKWKLKAKQEYDKFMKEKADREAELAAKKAEIIAKASEKSYGEQSSETASTLFDTRSEMDADKFLTVAEEHAILTSNMSRRQQEMELAKLRKDREERFKKIKTEQEIEENKIVVEKEKREAEYEKLSFIVHKLLRLSPIGNDRYHSRYWVLESVPGILVEKCWADPCISYEPPPLPEKKEEIKLSATVRTPISPHKDYFGAALSTENLPSNVNPEMKLITTMNGDVVSVAQEDEIEVIGEVRTNTMALNTGESGQQSQKEDMPAKLLPRVGQNCWFLYNTVEQVELLMKRLNEWGNRECALKMELRKHQESLIKKLKSAKLVPSSPFKNKINSPSPQSEKENKGESVALTAETQTNTENEGKDVQVIEEQKPTEVVEIEEDEDDAEKLPVLPKKFKDHYLNYLQSDMKDLHLRLFNGGLSWGDSETVENKIDATKTMEDMKKCIITIYECVFPKFFTGVLRPDYYQMAAADKKPRSEWCVMSPHESSNENAEDESAKREAFLSWCETKKAQTLPEGVKKWQLEVINASTWSRLHVLLALLDSCVRWEKSVAKSGCTVCRKKKDEDQTLLCDECNRAYHIYCLRPILKEIPAGDWLCPNCKPRETRRAASSKALSDQEDEKGDAISKDQQDSEEYCFCCLDGGDELIMCNTCPRVYHLHCHQPPMRRVPRGNWNCMVCLNPRLKRKKGFLFSDSQDDQRSKSSYYSDESDSEPHSRTTRSGTRSTRTTRVNQDSDSDEDQPRRSARSNKGTRGYDLYRNTLDRNRRSSKAAALDTDASTSDDESHSAAARRSGRRIRNRKYAESSDEESDQQTSRDNQSHPTSTEVSPDRDSGHPMRASKRKSVQVEKSGSESESEGSQAATSKKMKSSSENGKEAEKNREKDNNGEKYQVLEVAEEVDICEKIFYDIKSKNTFMFFENIAEVDAYSNVGNKVDFSTITVMMEESGYIWKGFIRDLAYIVNNAISVFEPSHKVHRAAIKLDERMRILMRNLPIMLNRYDQIRQGISEQDIQEENQAPQNSPLTTCTNKQPESSSGARDSSHGAVDDKNEAEATAASTVNESEEPSRNGGTSTLISAKQDELHGDDATSSGAMTRSVDSCSYASNKMTSSTNSSSSGPKKRWWLDEDLVAKRMERYRLNREERYSDISFEERRKTMMYVNECFKMVEINQEKDICAKMLHRLKSNISLTYFMNVSEVAAYAKIKSKMDFVKMESKMDKRGYLWQGFVTDLAIIVNNSLIAFPPKHTVYKAGIRLDKKVKKMLAKFPLMVQHFNKVRCQVDGFLDDDEGAEQQDATSAELEEQKKNDKGHVIEKTPRIETDHENDKGHVIEKTPRIETDHDQDDSQHVADESFEEKCAQAKRDESMRVKTCEEGSASKTTNEVDSSCHSVEKKSSANSQQKPKQSCEEIARNSEATQEPAESSLRNEECATQQAKDTSQPETLKIPPKEPSQQQEKMDNTADKKQQKCAQEDKYASKKQESKFTESAQFGKAAGQKSETSASKPENGKEVEKGAISNKTLKMCPEKTVVTNKPITEKEILAQPTVQEASSASEPNAAQVSSPTKASSPTRQSASAKREVKMSEISFFGESESSECFTVCKKIFKEVREKQNFACFNSIHSIKALKNLERKVDLDYIAKEINTSSYSWNKFLLDVAEIVNNTLSLLPAESSPHKAALKLDAKMSSSLRNVPRMKKLYESLRSNAAPPKLKLVHQNLPKPASDQPMKSQDSSVTKELKTVPKTPQGRLSPMKETSKSETTIEISTENVSTDKSQTDKLISTRTLEKNEIETLCLNIFEEIKNDEDLVCLKYLTKDPVCQPIEKKIDLAKIEKKLTKPGYIWGKFIRDLAIVAQMAQSLYPKDCYVNKGSKALDRKIENSLRRFPVMFKKYSKVRHESLTGAGKDEEMIETSKREKESNGISNSNIENNLFKLMEKVDSPKQFVQNKTSYTSTKKEQQPQITSSLPKSNEHEAQKPEITVVASKFSPKQPEVNHERDSVSSGIWNLTCNTHKSTSEVNSKCSERAKTAEKKTTSPDAKDAHAVDSEDENKAVFDFLKELRSDKKFSCFEDLSKNPPELNVAWNWEEEPIDFVTIAANLTNSSVAADYGLNEMVLDLALIVNNAMFAFNINASYHSAGMRMDVKILTLLQSYPPLRQRYKKYRSEKRTSVSVAIPENVETKTENHETKTAVPRDRSRSASPKKQNVEKSPASVEDANARKKLKRSLESAAKEEHYSPWVSKSAKTDEHELVNVGSQMTKELRGISSGAAKEDTPSSGKDDESPVIEDDKNPASVSSVVTFLNAPVKKTASSSSSTSNLSQFVQKVEVDEVVDICHKILLDIRSKSAFQVFLNVSEVSSYSVVKKRVDLMSIESLMDTDGYIWQKFIQDLALIVNNAVVVFEPSHTVHKAALKMNSRLLVLMQRLPIMRGHYESIRANYQQVLRKRSKEADDRTSEKEFNDNDSLNSPERSARKKLTTESTSSNEHELHYSDSRLMKTPTKNPNIVLQRLTPDEVAQKQSDCVDQTKETATVKKPPSLVLSSKSSENLESSVSIKSEKSSAMPKSSDGVEKLSHNTGIPKTEITRTPDYKNEVIKKSNADTSDISKTANTTHNFKLTEGSVTGSSNIKTSSFKDAALESINDLSNTKSKKLKEETSIVAKSLHGCEMKANESQVSKSTSVTNSSSSSVSSSCWGPSYSSRASFVQKEEIDEEVDICEKIFLDIRTKTAFLFFENISCVSAYSDVLNKVDFCTIEKQLREPGYIWAKFIADMAHIVNNAHQVFEPSHKAYKAATRLDDRMKQLMRRLPIMMSHYVQERGGGGERQDNVQS